MDNKNTYHPDDIEELLIQKEYNELSSEEKSFVDSQINNPIEYAELRNTLIFIKKIAKEEQAILVSPSVKEELLAKFEENKSKAGWFSWNSIGVYLFPSGTPLFRKPGLQLALAGALLLFVINIGLYQLDSNPNNLALNTKKKEVEKEPVSNETENTSNEIQVEKENKEEPISELKQPQKTENIEPVVNKPIPQAPKPASAPSVEGVADFDLEEVVRDDKKIVKKLNSKEAKDAMPIGELNKLEIDDAIQIGEAHNRTTTQNAFVNVVPSTIVYDSAGSLTFSNDLQELSTVTVVSAEKVAVNKFESTPVKESSQSLSKNEGLIDLLFVTE